MSEGKVGTKLVIDGVPEYTAAIKNIKAAQAELRSEMRLVSTEFKNTANSEDALKAKHEILTKQVLQSEKQIEILSRVVKGYNDKLNETKGRIEEAKTAHGAESKEVEKAQAEYDRLSKELDVYKGRLYAARTDLAVHNNELTKTGMYLKEAAESADKCATSIDRFGNATKESGNAMELLAQSEVFEKMGVAAEEIVETLKECVEAADQFEYSMTKVQSIAQVDDSALAEMGEEIQELAVTYGASANEIAEATYQAISASVEAGEATDFVANAMKLARGGFTDTVTAVDVLTTTLNAYGKEANTTEHIMDALVTTQNLGKTTVGELAQNLGQVIPTAAGLNVSLDNLSAAYIQLTKNGVNTANSTTYINGLLTELSDKGSTVGKVLKKETGQSFGELMASGKSLGDVIQILGENVNGNSEAFLNMFGNVRAARGALTIFNNGADAFNASLEAIGDSAGAANEAFEIMADTSEMTQKRMEAAVENLKVSIGEALQPTIDGLKEKGIEMLVPVTEFIEKNPTLVKALAGAAGAVAGVTGAVAACAGAVAILNASFGNLASAAAVLGTAAAIGALGFMSSEADDFASSVDNASKAMQEMAARNQESAQSFSETEKKMLLSADNARKYAEEIKKLQRVEEYGTEQKNKMRMTVEKLNAILPELNLTIDEQTGKLDANSIATLENVEAMLKLQKAQVYMERNKELVEQMVDAENKLEDAKRKRIAAEEEYKELSESYSRKSRNVEDINAITEYDADKLNKAAESLRQIREVEAEAGEELQNLSDSYDRNTKMIEENTEASAEFAEGQEEVAASTGLSEEALEDLAKKYEKARESAVSSLQSQKEKFQELGEAARKGAEQSGESIDQFAQRIADQRKGIEEYSGNVEKALEFMIDNKWSEGLFSTIIQQGPEASGDLKLLLDTIDEGEDGVKKLKETCEDFDAFAPISEQVGEFQAKLETGIPITEEAIKKNKELIDSQGNVVHAYEDGHAAYKTHIETMEELAENEPTAVAEAVTATASKVAETEEKMLTDAIDVGYAVLGMEGEGAESSVFKDMGDQIVSSFVSGLKDPEGSVGAAIKSLCDAAVTAVDISGLSDKLSERVAKIVNDAETKMGEKVLAGATRQANMGGNG